MRGVSVRSRGIIVRDGNTVVPPLRWARGLQRGLRLAGNESQKTHSVPTAAALGPHQRINHLSKTTSNGMRRSGVPCSSTPRRQNDKRCAAGIDTLSSKRVKNFRISSVRYPVTILIVSCIAVLLLAKAAAISNHLGRISHTRVLVVHVRHLLHHLLRGHAAPGPCKRCEVTAAPWIRSTHHVLGVENLHRESRHRERAKR